VFRAFASQDANISRTVSDLPGTLSQATATLQKVQIFAQKLGPTARDLIPAARSLPAANAALTALATAHATPHGFYPGGTKIVGTQIRPFVVAARPLVRNLRPAAINLAAATPNLSGTFNTLNHVVNMLGYNPGNVEHGYLWWLAWLDHNARTLFSVQDANGVFRPLFIQASCAALNQIAQGVSGSALLLNLNPIIGIGGAGSSLCPPAQASAPATARTQTSSSTASTKH
jgi:phospholipid/cholesterol/gamma-HCH transport system substrate-binding protein